MKRMFRHFSILAVALIVSSTVTCAKFDDLDDQNPVLVVDIEVTDPVAIPISETQKVYLIYYVNKNWTNPWLQHGSGTPTIINPVVLSQTLYIAAFWDQNDNGVVDAGEPCTGWKNADHAAANELDMLTLLPLEWREVTITLDPAIVY
ncbi:MAG: hypothetical protein JW838_11640 [Spirochaetes bacterium]|nr:hypothetical protein [Spirochaetota bacterium]